MENKFEKNKCICGYQKNGNEKFCPTCGTRFKQFDLTCRMKECFPEYYQEPDTSIYITYTFEADKVKTLFYSDEDTINKLLYHLHLYDDFSKSKNVTYYSKSSGSVDVTDEFLGKLTYAFQGCVYYTSKPVKVINTTIDNETITDIDTSIKVYLFCDYKQFTEKYKKYYNNFNIPCEEKLINKIKFVRLNDEFYKFMSIFDTLCYGFSFAKGNKFSLFSSLIQNNE